MFWFKKKQKLRYKIDPDKIETIEDIKAVVKILAYYSMWSLTEKGIIYHKVEHLVKKADD